MPSVYREVLLRHAVAVVLSPWAHMQLGQFAGPHALSQSVLLNCGACAADAASAVAGSGGEPSSADAAAKARLGALQYAPCSNSFDYAVATSVSLPASMRHRLPVGA